MKKLLTLFISTGLILNLTACGTILHPERKGQTSGRLDAGVVLLDAVGLLFFFVPGVIAFAVDFSNGTIYLPDGYTQNLTDEEMQSVTVNGQVDQEKLKALIENKTALQLPEQPLNVTSLEDETQLAKLLKVYSPQLIAMNQVAIN
ncbi:hypothetical protein SAMN05216361_2558 [Marisediminitalea aggregata]|uniref:Uncharacterized protein n=1 Tax=Marisediminitalea aggregata TaxID=634436 RepID=A0A1M5L7H7_9ALTE|nr:hypothetical protein [Marisediminitalea aggregata]MAP21514.1 hypothetical protein [Alteromonadaceae bacterium]MAX42594.1 hypothetical protein [Alteromonadaceae bacterium]SHG61064.1 hypothetical protein SAMN05216361_2558 [Marisediminitalea aggregata]HBY38840.1 hypothetical protein [Alteromonas sp.]|tara:strand:+ start:147 stop:584 length:438 start_codon:yes stop_codon:yes gene_type:complete